jgi:hypothetical protein
MTLGVGLLAAGGIGFGLFRLRVFLGKGMAPVQ